jgi:hypothetical protein
MMGGAEIRVDDGAARARAQPCLQRQRQRQIERAAGVESFSLLARSSRALAEYSQRLCHPPSTALEYPLHTTPPPAPNAHTLGPCASDTRLQRYHSSPSSA